MASMPPTAPVHLNLKHGAWQQSGLKTASMPANFGIGNVLRARFWVSGVMAALGNWWLVTDAHLA